jgi:glycosyltransferase involved in cell wall biosynthesis
MKKLLILSYYFPPLGMGGTQRAAKFAKYLPHFNWQPTVITVKPIAYWTEDLSALDELESVRIIRTESWDPQRLLVRVGSRLKAGNVAGKGSLSFVNQRILSFFLVPDSKLLWTYHVLRAVKRLTAQEHFDAVLTTSPPHSVHLIGEKIARRYGMPWITDFRDAWSDSQVVHEPTWLQKRINSRLQARVLAKADAVIAVTRGIAERFAKSVPVCNRVHYIPNGFDPADYPQPGTKKADRFMFCHSGSITRFSYPDILLKALADLKVKRPDLAAGINLTFVGRDMTGDLAAMIHGLGLHDHVMFVGHKPHKEAMQYLVDADALVLIARGKPTDTFIPGKTYEYIGSCKPILAITSVPDTRTLLQEWPLAVLSGTKETEIADAIVKMVHGSFPNKKAANPDRYNRRYQTQQLAEVLNSVTAQRTG